MLNGGTTLTYTDKTAQILNGIELLVRQYIPYFVEVYRQHRPISVEDLKFPCVMIEQEKPAEKLVSTGKVESRNTYTIYFYIVNNSRDGLVEYQSQAMNALLKLFSNNALGDLQTTPTYKYKRWYVSPLEQYWIDSEIMAVEYSPTFSFFNPDKEQFCRAGRLTIEFADRFVR